MNLGKLKNQSGVTLIELLVVMVLIAVVAGSAMGMLSYGRLYVQKSQAEYEFQFSTRTTLEQTTDAIRYSTATFTIPKSSFRPDNLDAYWNYIGINEVEIDPGVISHEIVQYTYDPDSDTHVSKILIPAQPKIAYNFAFTKVNPQDEDSLLQFSIETFPAGRLDEFGRPSAALTITSEVESKNALQVVDLSNPPYDPAVAIAFRLHERTNSVVGHVAMVLDESGSMSDNLNGGSSGNRRIDILKDEAKELINNFAQEYNIDIGLVPFSTSANDPRPFQNAKNNTQALIDGIDSLVALGGTNTGDGLRRAYWALRDHNDTVGVGSEANNYVIILVDGVTTFASVISDSNRNFVTNDSNVNEGYLDRGTPAPDGQIAGNGSTLDPAGTAYVDYIGTNMLDHNDFAKAYVIGFSAISSELDSVNDIATACGAPPERVFTAGSSDDLNAVFEAIREGIVNDLWFLQGPQL